MPRGPDRDEVLRRTDLRALLDELSGPGIGHGAGARRWHCPVPDHDDVHPSVSVRVDRRGVDRWRCWSFGHGGTAIDALYHARGISFRNALDELARRAGVTPSGDVVQAVRAPLKPRPAIPLQRPARQYVEACERILWDTAGWRVLDYLVNERGLDADVLRANHVGADPGPKFSGEHPAFRRTAPARCFRVHRDGNLTYFQTRHLDVTPTRSKYGNPASRHGDNPRHGWTEPTTPSKKAPVVICEGFPDAYTANAAGYTAVAVLGTGNASHGLADAIAKGIGRRPAIMAFDGDDAGRTGGKLLATMLEQRGIMVVELTLPSGMDFNSWVHAAHQVPDLGPATRPPRSAARAPALAYPGP